MSNERRPGNVEMPWSSVYELLWFLHGQRRRWPVDLPVGPNSVLLKRWTYLGVGQSRIFVGVNITKVSLKYHVRIFYNGRNCRRTGSFENTGPSRTRFTMKELLFCKYHIKKHLNLKQRKRTRRRSHWRSLDILTVHGRQDEDANVKTESVA